MRIEAFRQQLTQSSEQIELLDLGAGSANQGAGQYQRSIGDVAMKASRRQKVGELLYRLCHHFQPQRCLEFGTNLGISALYQLSGLSQSRFVSMEGSPILAELAQQHVTAFDMKAEILCGEFDTLLDTQLDLSSYRPDYVFIDGNHRYAPTLRYFQRLIPHIPDGGILIFDDIHWSREMTQAWEEIIQSPAIHVSIDLFHVGLCFVRSQQAKEDFCLRF